MAAAALVAAVASALATHAPTLPWLVGAQLVAGAAWSGVIVAAFAWALTRSGAGRAGAFAGALSAVLALATLARMASVAAGWPQSAAFAEALAWWPVAGWLAASVGIVLLLAQRRREPA
jgi:thiol:disulfide interchange protein